MPTRDYEYREVRRMLGNPIEQRPDSDRIISALIREEQFMYNRLNGTGKSWTEDSVTLISVANQPSYTLGPGEDNGTCGVALGSPFGKALYVYRDLGNNVILPVPFTDQNTELMNQSYDGFQIPLATGLGVGSAPAIGSNKIAFYRTTTGVKKARIYPIPEESGSSYTIIYATGAIDWTLFQWGDTPILPEWSSYRCLMVAMTLLADCEWDRLTYEQNDRKRTEREKALRGQFDRQDAEYQSFIRNPQNEPSIDTIGAWYDDGSIGRTVGSGVQAQAPSSSPGPTGHTLLPAAYFNWNDTSPVTLATANSSWIITSLTVVVLAPFNGSGAQASVGTIASPSLLMAAADMDITVNVTYQNEPSQPVSSGIPIAAFITPGSGATQGRCMIFIEYAPVD